MCLALANEVARDHFIPLASWYISDLYDSPIVDCVDRGELERAIAKLAELSGKGFLLQLRNVLSCLNVWEGENKRGLWRDVQKCLSRGDPNMLWLEKDCERLVVRVMTYIVLCPDVGDSGELRSDLTRTALKLLTRSLDAVGQMRGEVLPDLLTRLNELTPSLWPDIVCGLITRLSAPSISVLLEHVNRYSAGDFDRLEWLWVEIMRAINEDWKQGGKGEEGRLEMMATVLSHLSKSGVRRNLWPEVQRMLSVLFEESLSAERKPAFEWIIPAMLVYVAGGEGERFGELSGFCLWRQFLLFLEPWIQHKEMQVVGTLLHHTCRDSCYIPPGVGRRGIWRGERGSVLRDRVWGDTLWILGIDPRKEREGDPVTRKKVKEYMEAYFHDKTVA